jgi:hypothetical protein
MVYDSGNLQYFPDYHLLNSVNEKHFNIKQ